MPAMAADGKPVLWHIPISHYSEKVRWALDYKGIEHERKTPSPPFHMLVALAMTGGRHKTFPVLKLDGKRIGDSTAAIAALEARYPEPSLYPADLEERRRALELEDWFDEQLGPQIRLFAWHEITHDRDRLEELAPKLGAFGSPGVAARGVRIFVNARFRVKSPAAAQAARGKVVEALDRLEAELGGGEYLVGDRFTVADLTAAALFYPLVLPEGAPKLLETLPAAVEEFRAPLRERPGYRWVEETYRRHRNLGAARSGHPAEPVGAAA